MIRITNNQGVDLELFSNQPLITEQAAAWLVDDELPAEYSYPIDAPLTENNQRFVAHGYRPDSATPRQVMPVTVSLGGVLYRRALMAFKLQGGKLNIGLKIDSAEAYDKLRKISLLEALKTPVKIGDGLVGSVNGNAIILPLADRLGQIAVMPPGSFPAAFFPIRNELFFEEDWKDKVPGAVPGPQPYVNLFTKMTDGINRFAVDTAIGDGVVRGFPICPQLHLWWVLEQIMLLAGFRIESDWLAQESIQRLCILNMTALPPFNATFEQLLGGHFFIPGQCLPDMSVSDFLKAIKGRFGLCFTFNANTRVCHIAQFSQAVAKGPAIDLTPFQSGGYDASDPVGTGFAVRDLIDSQDELYKDLSGKLIEPAPLIVGKGGTEISLKVGSCQSIYLESNLTPSGRWQVPTVRQPGNLLDPPYKDSERYVDADGNRRNSIGLRLLSYEGMQPDSTGAYYPFGSTERGDLAGRNGIWRNGLRQYFFFRDQSQPVVQKLLLPADRLAGLQLHRSVSLSLNDMIRRSYLITKLRSQAPGPGGLLVVETNAQTVPGGIDQPADVDEPFVYLELIQETQAQIAGPLSSTVNANFYDQTKLTVKVWADKAKTQAAIVTKLSVRLRLLKTWPVKPNITQLENGQIRANNYRETRTTYLIEGSQTVVENALKTYLFYTGASIWEEYTLKVQLDPGEGYGIL